MTRRPSPLAFRPPSVPTFTCRPPEPPEREDRRGSAHARGYDAPWDRLAKAHRRLEPTCRECAFRGRVTAATLTNHVVPLRDRPDLRLDPTNLSSACQRCHDQIIRALEDAARRQGDVELLRTWLVNPATRPLGYAFEAVETPSFLRRARHAHRTPRTF